MKIIFLTGLFLVWTLTAFAAEELILDTPVPASPTTKWQLDELHIAKRSQVVRMIFYEPTTQELKPCETTGAAAQALIVQLNTANMTNNSLARRALTYAQSSGCLAAGIVTGTPE